MQELSSDVGKIHLLELPPECPFCHKSIIPSALYGHMNNKHMEVFMGCPNCRKAFIGHYSVSSSNQYTFTGITTGGTVSGKEFTRTVKDVSPSFISVYNQSLSAENHNLAEISGLGYRKALEILIKDYAIRKYADDREKIEQKTLGRTIEEFVDDVRVRSIAKRAIWLGSEESQYLKKWEGKNLLDVKKLIELTIHWIEMEELSMSFES